MQFIKTLLFITTLLLRASSLSTVDSPITTSTQLTSVCAAISTTVSIASDSTATAIIDVQLSEKDFIIGFNKYKVYSYISLGREIEASTFQFLSLGLDFLEGQAYLKNGSFFVSYELIAPSIISDLVISVLSQFVIGKDLIIISALPDSFTNLYCSKNAFVCLPITLTQLITCSSSDNYVISPPTLSKNLISNIVQPNVSLPISLAKRDIGLSISTMIADTLSSATSVELPAVQTIVSSSSVPSSNITYNWTDKTRVYHL